uniref:G patch domain-containing protein 11 n=1 Tax=Astyanax mexicanus TaxID=7994 RepID=A0A3B1K2X6_ASTMX
MSSDEEDYMSDAFLNPQLDVRPGVPMVKREKAARKREDLHKEKCVHNRQKSIKQQELEQRQEALQSSISTENKGFALLQKMGYKAGQGLGREGSGRVDPIPLNIKTDRGGIGLEELKKRKAAEELEHHRKKVQIRKQMEKRNLEDFRDRKRSEKEKQQAEADLRRSQRACQQLDTQQGKVTPKDVWYWPEVITEEAEHPEESSDEESDEEEMTSLEKLQYITSYLRDVHFYCIWCGTAYNDEEDLSSNCPGDTAADHND